MSTSSDLNLWGIAIKPSSLTPVEAEYLRALPETLPSNEWVWIEMDRIWDELGLVNTLPLGGQPIGEFYRHPVWLMNGVFSVVDPTSSAHRRAIAHYVETVGPRKIADYGGGFGELALQIAEVVPTAKMSIIEPYPSRAARDRLGEQERITFVREIRDWEYDLMVAQDVLEHVEQPLELAIDLVRSVRPGGTVIFANNFTPIIQCHLPATFHFRYTFPLVMLALGLRYRGSIPSAEHAEVYEVRSSLHVRRARAAERLSRAVGPTLAMVARLLPVAFSRELLRRVRSFGTSL